MRKLFGWSTVLILAMAAGMLAGAMPGLAAAGDWYAEYFNNPTLSGGPVLTRSETGVNFDWGAGSPGAGVPVDNFSARFTHDEWFDGGNYRFSYRSDDGVRVWVGDELVVDEWRDGPPVWKSTDRFIAQGSRKVRIEYYERSGGAVVQVSWSKVSTGASWRADYYANTGFAGNPTLTRNEAAIDFDWGAGSPDPSIPVDGFTARWTRTLGLEAGAYRFYASADDGVRIFVDYQKVVDAWQKQKLPNTHSGDITLSAGQHTIVVEYFEEGGEAAAHVWWNKLGAFSGWEGRYYDNPDLRGGPALIRDDAEINFDWGQGAPSDWIPSDNFSISWTRQINLKPGLYRFNTRADDGVRLWVDDTNLWMNYWEPQDFTWRYQDWTYLEGAHTLKVEYFEQAGNARIQFWWDYAVTVEAAQAMPPSPTYSFTTAPAPSAKPTAPQPATPAAPLPGPWQGEYFNSRDLNKTPALVRTDATIDFDWGWDSPAPAIPANQFAVRWTGTFTFEEGRYRFVTTTDDGVRLYVDDQPAIDNWRAMHGTRYGAVNLTAGQHTVRVEYFEATQAAKARVSWARIGAAPAPAAPSSGGAAQTAPGPWDVRYYSNAGLSGAPLVALTGQNVPLDFDWGLGSPDPAVPNDNFSASWQQTSAFDTGRYTFSTYSDDGVRLYIDDRLIINSWYPMRGSRSATVDLTGGSHTLRLEYFERTGAAVVRLTVKKN